MRLPCCRALAASRAAVEGIEACDREGMAADKAGRIAEVGSNLGRHIA